jgi:pimeloyl-ACP methyl ester carboxylesterase
VDGTEIRWRRDGAGGGAPILLCNGIACSDAYWFGVAPRLAGQHPVVRWDYRGHGRSGDPVDRRAVGVAACTEDLRAVLDAAGVSRAVLVGHSYGAQVALEAYRLVPQRVSAVVAVAGAPGRPLARRGDRQAADRLLAALHTVAATAPRAAGRTWDTVWGARAVHRLARVLGATTVDAPVEVMQEYFAHVRDRDPELLLDMMQAMQEHSAGDLLHRLAVPLLVLAGDRDRVTPLEVLRQAVLAAPDSELVIRHGAAHTLPAEHPAWVADEIVEFLSTRRVR